MQTLLNVRLGHLHQEGINNVSQYGFLGQVLLPTAVEIGDVFLK